MSSYVTTNIRISEDDYLRLKEEAAKKRTSLSAIVREKIGAKAKKLSREEYRKILLTPTPWFTENDYKDYQKIREEWGERLKRYDW